MMYPKKYDEMPGQQMSNIDLLQELFLYWGLSSLWQKKSRSYYYKQIIYWHLFKMSSLMTDIHPDEMEFDIKSCAW